MVTTSTGIAVIMSVAIGSGSRLISANASSAKPIERSPSEATRSASDGSSLRSGSCAARTRRLARYRRKRSGGLIVGKGMELGFRFARIRAAVPERKQNGPGGSNPEAGAASKPHPERRGGRGRTLRLRSALRRDTGFAARRPARSHRHAGASMPPVSIPIPVLTIGLLILSNVFMTFAWYGHLKFKMLPLSIAILISRGIALFEYILQVPANRWGYGYFNAAKLKTIQEVITLYRLHGVPGDLGLGEPVRWNHAVGFGFIVLGAWFVFQRF